MWWSSRHILVALALPALLAACAEGGYRPVNAAGGAAVGLRQGAISTRAPDTEAEYALVARIEERLGRQGRSPAYALDYSLAVSEDPVGVRKDQATQRYNVLGRLSFSVTPIAGGAVLTSGMIDSFTSYSATGGAVSGLAAQEDAHARLAVLLADQLVLRLGATADAWALPAAAPVAAPAR